jgi:RNA polymerase sigma-70 factor (ECF subfamily)
VAGPRRDAGAGAAQPRNRIVRPHEYNPVGGRGLRVGEERLKALMIRGLDGDAVAHRQLLSELAGILLVFFQRRTINTPFDAEDLVQETLIAVHNRRMSYDVGRPFIAWAFAMARYKLADAYRRRNIRATEPLDSADEVAADDETEAAGAKVDIERLLAELPAKQREAIRHMKIEGLSVAEAAERSGLSESSVKVSVHRGLKRLMALIKRDAQDAV